MIACRQRADLYPENLVGQDGIAKSLPTKLEIDFDSLGSDAYAGDRLPDAIREERAMNENGHVVAGGWILRLDLKGHGAAPKR